MKKADPASRQFCEVLKDYIKRNGMPVTHAAEIMRRPAHTVRKWYKGTHGPHKKEIPVLCARMGWNYKAIFSQASRADVFFEQQVIGFEVLQHRYLELKLKNPFAALSLLIQAGALAFVYFLESGIEGKLVVESNFVSRMVVSPAVCEPGIVIPFEARGYSGLGFYVMDVHGNLLTEWRTLGNAHLDMAVLVIKSLRKPS